MLGSPFPDPCRGLRRPPGKGLACRVVGRRLRNAKWAEMTGYAIFRRLVLARRRGRGPGIEAIKAPRWVPRVPSGRDGTWIARLTPQCCHIGNVAHSRPGP